MKSSSTPTEKKPGRTAKVWLRCDRGGHYRPRNGLTEETRKRRRTSRLMDCPFMLVAAGSPGIWTLTVLNPTHNHGPIVDKPRQPPHHKVRKGQLPAIPYDWPHDASFTPYTTALVIIDMQKDCKWSLSVFPVLRCQTNIASSLCAWRIPRISGLRHFCRAKFDSQAAAIASMLPLRRISSVSYPGRYALRPDTFSYCANLLTHAQATGLTCQHSRAGRHIGHATMPPV